MLEKGHPNDVQISSNNNIIDEINISLANSFLERALIDSYRNYLASKSIPTQTAKLETEFKLPVSLLNSIIELIEFYNDLYLINEFTNDLIPLLKNLNTYLNKNLDRSKFKVFIGFYTRLFRERSHNFKNIRKFKKQISINL